MVVNASAVVGLALLPLVIPDPPLTYPHFTLVGSLWLLLVVVQEARAGPGDQGGEAAPGGVTGTA